MLAGEGLRWQWLPSTQGPYWEEGSSGFSFLAAGLEEAVCFLVVAAMYLLGRLGWGPISPGHAWAVTPVHLLGGKG